MSTYIVFAYTHVHNAAWLDCVKEPHVCDIEFSFLTIETAWEHVNSTYC